MLDEVARLQVLLRQDDPAQCDEYRRQFEVWLNSMRDRADGYYGPQFEPATVAPRPAPSRQPTARRGRRRAGGVERRSPAEDRESSPVYIVLSPSDEGVR